jgi:hypothetical protein
VRRGEDVRRRRPANGCTNHAVTTLLRGDGRCAEAGERIRWGGLCLPSHAHGLWLDPLVRDVDPLQALLVPYPAAEMIAYPVSTRVNSPANDTPECIAPLA